MYTAICHQNILDIQMEVNVEHYFLNCFIIYCYLILDDLPPPPPPIDLSGGLADYAPCTVNTQLPPPPDHLMPPPSPVSSSYSELRRATQPGQSFHDYSLGSQVK